MSTVKKVQDAIKKLTPEDKEDIIKLMRASERGHPWLIEDVSQTLEIGLRLYVDVFCSECREPLVATWHTQEHRDAPAFDMEVKPCKTCTRFDIEGGL